MLNYLPILNSCYVHYIHHKIFSRRFMIHEWPGMDSCITVMHPYYITDNSVVYQLVMAVRKSICQVKNSFFQSFFSSFECKLVFNIFITYQVVDNSEIGIAKSLLNYLS